MKYGSIVEVGVKFLSVKNVGSVKEKFRIKNNQ